MLPLVVRFNSHEPQARRAYAELASAPEIACVSNGLEKAVNALIARLESLLNAAQIARSLADCGVEKSNIKLLAREAAKQWTAAFNPRPITARDFETLYLAAFKKRGEGDGNGR
jgi:alcohol dehydrogenase